MVSQVNQSDTTKKKPCEKPTREEAEQAVRTLILWAGDNPDREGLENTPSRVAESYKELFVGYEQDSKSLLFSRTFKEYNAYEDCVLLKDIDFSSFCEHHMLPIVGKVHVAYMPDGCIIGISKLVRLVEVYARRLQVQEGMTAQIADDLEQHLKPKGLAVLIDAEHYCMRIRGVNKSVKMNTKTLRGCFKEARLESYFLNAVNS